MIEPFVQDSDFTLYQGDALEVLRRLPAESVHCCVTSPPYWGLRDYGMDGQLGLEATPEEYVARMVGVFREVRRVLRGDGTCWLNIGDSYAGSGKGPSNEGSKQRTNIGSLIPGQRNPGQFAAAQAPTEWLSVPHGLKSKDLVGIPWRLAFALQADGWYLRSDIIWSKPNPMPESVTDRPTKAHEYVFLLSKGPRYFFDQEAVRETATYFGPNGSPATMDGAANSRPGEMKGRAGVARRKPLIPNQTKAGVGTQGIGSDSFGHWAPNGRNVRSVWEIATEPYPEAHFATFPQALVERCIKAGSPKVSCPNHGPITGGPQTCTLCELSPRPGIVLDPFLGSGTTALVARRLGRRSLGVELSPDYCALAARRLQQLSLLAEAGG